MKTNEQRKRSPMWERERTFPCNECGAKPGENCLALKNTAHVKRGVSIVPHHISRTLLAKIAAP